MTVPPRALRALLPARRTLFSFVWLRTRILSWHAWPMCNARCSDEPQCARSRYMFHTFRGTSHGVVVALREICFAPSLSSRRARVRLDANLVKAGFNRRAPVVEAVWSYLIGPWWSVIFWPDFLETVPPSGYLRKIKIITPENSMTAEEFAATPSRNYILLLGTIGIIMTRVLRHYN